MTLPSVSMSEITVHRSSEGSPEITDVNYDLWFLRITLSFAGSRNPTYVQFEGVEGFRVLDEGQLLEFWGKDAPNTWLYLIQSGGWLSLEQTREGAPSLSELSGLKEYLVAGINDCVSVIAHEAPTIVTAAP